MKSRAGMVVVLAAGALFFGACSDHPSDTLVSEVAPTPKKMVVWLDEDGIDAETATRMSAAGVDQVVVRRGTIRLTDGAPVVQLLPAPAVAGPIPVAVALEVQGLGSGDDRDAADAVWAALEADFGSAFPTELILDLPSLEEGAAPFTTQLAQQSGLAVVPILTLSQLQTELGRAVARAAHRCLIPVAGPRGNGLRGIADLGNLPLADRLEVVRDLGIKIRVAAALRPVTSPDSGGWAEDLDPVTDGEVTETQRTSTLDRSYVFNRRLEWGGRSFNVGQSLAVSWMDTARLGLFFAESQRTILPEIEGWDLISLPPGGPNLGLDREELIRYLAGEGPQPTVQVRVQRSGRSVSVRLVNTGVFRSAVTRFGNWVQLEIAAGSLVATSRGEFDRVVLGSMARGTWQPNPDTAPNAVRFVENYLAPGEEIRTGTIRLPSSRSRYVVRWQIQLSDGSTLGGVAN